MLSDNQQLDVARAKCVSEVSALLRRCTRDHRRWADSAFPAGPDAIWYAPGESHADAESSGMRAPDRWLRVGDFLPRPVVLFPEPPAAVDPRGLMQGDVGSRALVDAAAALAAANPAALRALFVRPEAFSSGVVPVAFWANAQWRIVFVDDSVPVLNSGGSGVGSVCCYAESKQRRSVWLPLLEKAYAKLHRYYEHIHGGDPRLALVDVTGGATVDVDLTNPLDAGITRLHAYRGLVGDKKAVLHIAFAAGGVAGAAIVGEDNADEDDGEGPLARRTEFIVNGTYDEQGYIKFSATPTDRSRPDATSWQFICISDDAHDLRGDAWPTDSPDASVKWSVQWLRPAAPSFSSLSPEDGSAAASMAASTAHHALDDVWSTGKMLLSLKRHILIVTASDPEAALRAGLVPDRRYLVLGMIELKNKARIVKLRDIIGNPEWNGDYCEQSPLWDTENLQVWLDNYDDGVFFMSWDDFHKYFARLEITVIPPPKSIVQSVHGPWKGIRGPEHWIKNPRFKISLTEASHTTVALTLSQPNTKLYEGFDHYLIGIGFCVLMEVTNHRKAPEAAAAAAAANPRRKHGRTTYVIAHVPAQKMRDVSLVLSLYRIETHEVQFSGVYYVVPFADTDNVDLPLFLTVASSQRVVAEYIKGRSSAPLPMPQKTEPYGDEYEKWYWEVRDSWEGVGVVLPRQYLGSNDKSYAGLEPSLDAPTAAQQQQHAERTLTPVAAGSVPGRPSTSALLQDVPEVDKMKLRRYSMPPAVARPSSGTRPRTGSGTRGGSQEDIARGMYKGMQVQEDRLSPTEFLDDLGTLNEPEATPPQQPQPPQHTRPMVAPLPLEQLSNPLKARARLPTLHGRAASQLRSSGSMPRPQSSDAGSSRRPITPLAGAVLPPIEQPPSPTGAIVGWVAEAAEIQQQKLRQQQQSPTEGSSAAAASHLRGTVVTPRNRSGSEPPPRKPNAKRRSMPAGGRIGSSESSEMVPGAPQEDDFASQDKSKACRVM